jgi:hypothetical protein
MSTASDLLTLYLAAEKKILLGQSTQLGDRTLTLANLAEVRKERENLERRVAAENRSQMGFGRAGFSQADFS